MGANRSVVGCVFLMFVDGGQRPLNEECEAAPVRGEGVGGTSLWKNVLFGKVKLMDL